MPSATGGFAPWTPSGVPPRSLALRGTESSLGQWCDMNRERGLGPKAPAGSRGRAPGLRRPEEADGD